MHENVGYTKLSKYTELITNCCYKGLSHNALGPTGVIVFMPGSLPDISVLL